MSEQILPAGSAGRSARTGARILNAAAREVDRLSNGRLGLLWGITENLADWSVVRKRLNEELQRWQGTLLAGSGAAGGNFSRRLELRVHEANLISWLPDAPAQVFPASTSEAARRTVVAFT